RGADLAPRRGDQGRRPDPGARRRQARRARHARRADRGRRRVQRPLSHAARDRAAGGPGKLMAVASTPPRAGVEAEAVLGKAYDVRLIRRIAKYIRPHGLLLVAWGVLMLTTIGFELAQPWVFMYSLEHHILT